MKRWVRVIGLGTGVCCAFLLIANSVDIRQARHREPERAELPAASLALAPAPALPEPKDPDREWIRAQAEKLAFEFPTADPPLVEGWDAEYSSTAEFLVQGPDGRRWVTVTTGRLPCEQVDQMLERAGDPQMGDPDRCQRWLKKTVESLSRHGIHDHSPVGFLSQSNAETSVRVMLVYAGWRRSDGPAGEIELVAALPAPVYPESGFGARSRAALDGIYRSLKLGPHAEE